MTTIVASERHDMIPKSLIPFSKDCAILMYWQVTRPNGQTLACTSYRTAGGLELRAGLVGETPALRADVMTHAEAQHLAELWRQEIVRSVAA